MNRTDDVLADLMDCDRDAVRELIEYCRNTQGEETISREPFLAAIGGQQLGGGLTHAELADSLAEHFRGGDRVVWRERGIGARWMAQYAGRGLATPDVFTIQKTFARRAIAAYEVKASEADFRSDITSGKWTKYLPLCNRFYFATPRGLVTKADIPAEAGWTTLGENGWSVVKAAPYSPDTGDLGEDEWLCLIFYLDDHKRRVRDLADRAAIVANMESHKFAAAVSERLAQALSRAGDAARESKRETERYEKLFEIACESLGLSAEELRDSYFMEGKVRAACSALSPAKRKFLREVGYGLIGLADQGDFGHQVGAELRALYAEDRQEAH